MNTEVSSLSLLFLLSINAPIKKTKELPPLNSSIKMSIRDFYSKDMTYYYSFKPT